MGSIGELNRVLNRALMRALYGAETGGEKGYTGLKQGVRWAIIGGRDRG